MDFIVRKLTMGRLLRWRLAAWSDMSRDQLREISVDSHEPLANLPGNWSAEEVSAFVCGRQDWPFLASTYMCLWKAVTDAMPDACSRCLDALPQLKEAAQSFHRAQGFAPHPYVLVQSAGLLHRSARKRKGDS